MDEPIVQVSRGNPSGVRVPCGERGAADGDDEEKFDGTPDKGNRIAENEGRGGA